jgi:hypothetical protein
MSGLRSLQTHKRTSIALLAIRNGFFGKTEFAFRTTRWYRTIASNRCKFLQELSPPPGFNIPCLSILMVSISSISSANSRGSLPSR